MNEETKYELVKFIDNELELEVSVSPKEETVWMTANQMALLFNKDEKTIRKHINNIFKDGELIYNEIGLSGSSAAKNNSWATTDEATASLI